MERRTTRARKFPTPDSSLSVSLFMLVISVARILHFQNRPKQFAFIGLAWSQRVKRGLSFQSMFRVIEWLEVKQAAILSPQSKPRWLQPPVVWRHAGRYALKVLLQIIKHERMLEWKTHWTGRQASELCALMRRNLCGWFVRLGISMEEGAPHVVKMKGR